LFLALAVAIAGVALFAASFVSSRALDWVMSLSAGELLAFRAGCMLLTIASLAVVGLQRWRRRDPDTP